MADLRETMQEAPDETLEDLRCRLEAALAQCREVVTGGDPLLEDHRDVPEPLASELRHWPSDDAGRSHFSDRGGMLAAALWRLEALETVAGGATPVQEVLSEVDGILEDESEPLVAAGTSSGREADVTER